MEPTTPLTLSVLVISILHAILPNHWLPVVAISRELGWTTGKTVSVTMVAAFAHSLSTVIIGILLAIGGTYLNEYLPYFRYIAAALLILLGILFVWRHQHHLHFHLKKIDSNKPRNMAFILGSLWLAMFLSPCLEVGGLFVASGMTGFSTTVLISLIYTITSMIGMTFFAWMALHGLKKIDWHKIEHNSGLISGSMLILTGFLFLIIH